MNWFLDIGYLVFGYTDRRPRAVVTVYRYHVIN